MSESTLPLLMLAETVTEAQDGVRLDVFVAQHSELSRARLQKLIRNGQCRLNRHDLTSEPRSPSMKLQSGDKISLHLPPPTESHLIAEPMPLNILYEDDTLLVLDKPAGLVVHPGAGNRAHTLVNALMAHCGDSLSGIGGQKRPGIVHRLDKDTSGVMVVAKCDRAHTELSAQFAAHGRDGRMQRHYEALVWGQPLPPIGTVDASLARATRNRTKMAVSQSAQARPAMTRYKQLACYAEGHVTHVQCTLQTGRTHQIRVHMAHIGHPVLGDKAYGSHMTSRATHLTETQQIALKALGRQALHARALGFEHPISGAAMRFETPLPTDMATLIQTFSLPQMRAI